MNTATPGDDVCYNSPPPKHSHSRAHSHRQSLNMAQQHAWIGILQIRSILRQENKS